MTQIILTTILIALGILYFFLSRATNKRTIVRINDVVEIYENGVLVITYNISII